MTAITPSIVAPGGAMACQAMPSAGVITNAGSGSPNKLLNVSFLGS
ncbi:hypothetical protein ACFORH_11265 [Amycolatopsis roodepoortensis]|uniref:Uncharacterized protein n=1 Tax=Amycolatopsis roodepoortensis TaxID=700274 RepID=A0ABR9LAQ6_9PSEU|nr:hypothetical protein [Amycolatopsis roodepoortensis]MBE1577764.1 hypothetical protein [Amycolatopsis roodepoortensis]